MSDFNFISPLLVSCCLLLVEHKFNL